MEQDLGAFIDQQAPLEPAHCSDFLIQLAKAIGALHDQSLLWDHRKRSVFIKSDGKVQIEGDLQSRRDSLSPGEIDVERDFFPPECIDGGAHDARSDVFALGVLAYEAITGKSPFSGKTVLEIMTAMKYPDIAPPQEIVDSCPSELGAVVVRMLSKAPDNRFQTMLEVVSALESLPDRS